MTDGNVHPLFLKRQAKALEPFILPDGKALIFLVRLREMAENALQLNTRHTADLFDLRERLRSRLKSQTVHACFQLYMHNGRLPAPYRFLRQRLCHFIMEHIQPDAFHNGGPVAFPGRIAQHQDRLRNVMML